MPLYLSSPKHFFRFRSNSLDKQTDSPMLIRVRVGTRTSTPLTAKERKGAPMRYAASFTNRRVVGGLECEPIKSLRVVVSDRKANGESFPDEQVFRLPRRFTFHQWQRWQIRHARNLSPVIGNNLPIGGAK